MQFYFIILILLAIQLRVFFNVQRKILEEIEGKRMKVQKQVKEAKSTIVKKNGNHLFGLPIMNASTKIDLSRFTNILSMNEDTITVEGGVKIDEVLRYLIPKGYILNIIPDMSHLTFGGIISGVGGGSSSFQYGMFHESVTQFDIIIGNGDILTCSPSQHSDLFYGAPNTLGTLGYILSLTFKIRKCSPYVKTENKRYTNAKDYFSALQKYQKNKDIDFLDGTIYGNDLFVLVVGYFKDELEGDLDNFVNDNIYWKAIKEDDEHWFKTLDYIYRWDTDMYYTSMIIPEWMNNRNIRKCVPADLIPYIKKALPYLGVDNNINDIAADILIPFNKMIDFYTWYNKEVCLYPVYICPALSRDDHSFWKGGDMCDFGIGYGIESKNDVENTKKIEKKMVELDGIKLLYTKSRMSEKEFWKIYDKKTYMKLRKKYHSNFPSVYEKIKCS